MTLLLLMT